MYNRIFSQIAVDKTGEKKILPNCHLEIFSVYTQAHFKSSLVSSFIFLNNNTIQIRILDKMYFVKLLAKQIVY